MRRCGIGSGQANTTSTWSTLATTMSSSRPRGPGWRRLNLLRRGRPPRSSDGRHGQRHAHAVADHGLPGRLRLRLSAGRAAVPGAGVRHRSARSRSCWWHAEWCRSRRLARRRPGPKGSRSRWISTRGLVDRADGARWSQTRGRAGPVRASSVLWQTRGARRRRWSSAPPFAGGSGGTGRCGAGTVPMRIEPRQWPAGRRRGMDEIGRRDRPWRCGSAGICPSPSILAGRPAPHARSRRRSGAAGRAACRGGDAPREAAGLPADDAPRRSDATGCWPSSAP